MTRLFAASVALGAVVLTLPPRAATQERATAPAAEPTLADLARLVEEQRRLIEDQRQEIEKMRTDLEQTRTLALSAHNRLQALDQQPPEATVPNVVEERLAQLEQSVQHIPDIPADVVSAGDFPGSFRIPGTDAALRIQGLVRMTAVNTFGPLGTEDRFVTSSIPVAGTPERGKQARTAYTANPTRFSFDMRTPTGVGAMRAFIEGDFAGSGRTLRLRHAYGQWGKWIAGQTWSTFADPEAEPDGIDFEGLNAISLFRQPQVRFTHKLKERVGLALALENPSPDITGATGISQVPDLIARIRWTPEKGRGLLGLGLYGARGSHNHVALLFRQLRGEPTGQPNTTLSTYGFGVNLSGRLPAPWGGDRTQIIYAGYGGWGIGRYISDLGTLGGQDAVYDPATNTLQALPVFAAYVGLERSWSRSRALRSTVTYGFVYVDDLTVQPPDALRNTNRGSLNLSWSPIPRVDLVVEYLLGNRVNNDGSSGFSNQLQMGGNFRF
jgi:hypothetical protein